ncbi:hypothetical protein B7494_g4408 [Chlorociboria aeruginascens]|nr:hypothetical protein B7494_g4408 [Chlorociboria aeruginascens]
MMPTKEKRQSQWQSQHPSQQHSQGQSQQLSRQRDWNHQPGPRLGDRLTYGPSVPLTKFTIFNNLTEEFRIMIWKAAMPGRVIELTPSIHDPNGFNSLNTLPYADVTPGPLRDLTSIMLSCHEARRIALLTHIKVPFSSLRIIDFRANSSLWINYQQDVVYLNVSPSIPVLISFLQSLPRKYLDQLWKIGIPLMAFVDGIQEGENGGNLRKCLESFRHGGRAVKELVILGEGGYIDRNHEEGKRMDFSSSAPPLRYSYSPAFSCRVHIGNLSPSCPWEDAQERSVYNIFQQFTHGGTLYPVYTYIRPNTNYNSPVTDLTSTDLRCNVGCLTGNTTETIQVSAGDAFSFTTDVAVYHDGPLSIYMAKVPAGETASTYDGSGQTWFKILDIGPSFDASGTATWDLLQTYSYTIPKSLPNGDYLLRVQQLAIHNPWPAGIPQFYLECAQITVTNGGSGTPGPLVEIPGFITGTEPGYTVNIYSNFHNYTVPGPAVWAGQNSNPGSGSGSGSSVVSSAAPTSSVAASSVATSVVASSTPTGAVVAKYGQCGGISYTGSTVCAAGSTCTRLLADDLTELLESRLVRIPMLRGVELVTELPSVHDEQ